MVSGTYIMELRAVNEEVQRILAMYETFPEDAHPAEDAVIERVVRELAHTSLLANALIPLFETERTKWYS